MNHFRTLASLVLAVVVGAFALPGFAQTSPCPSPSKCYSVDVHPASGINTSVPDSSTTTANVYVTITNETPSTGVSTINSFIIQPPANVSVVDPATTNDNTGMTATKGSDGNIYVNGFNGLKSGQKSPYYLTVKLRVTYPTLSCGQQFTWGAQAFNGNSFGNSSNYSFIQVVGLGTTGVTNKPTNATQTAPTCSISLSAASSTLNGGAIGSPATVTGSPAAFFASGTATLGVQSCTKVADASTCTASLAGTYSGVSFVNGVASFPGVTITVANGTDAQGYNVKLSASTSVAGVSSTTASLFVGPSDGPLDCSVGGSGGTSTFTGTSTTQSTDVSGGRSANKDGSKCVVVQYDLTVTDTEVHVQWDTNLQPFAALQYTVDYKPRPVDSSTGLGKKLQVKWGSMTQYVDAQMCSGSTLPTSYGTLAAAIAPSTPDAIQDISVTTNTSAPTTYPFAITIDQERMTVLSAGTAGGTWSVKRGQGGTAAAGHAITYSDGSTKQVMSNPLPLYTGTSTALATGAQMAMCMASENYYTDADFCSPQSLSACVGLKVKLFDVGDGWNTWP